MKDGICPKCESEEIYKDKSERHGIVIWIQALAVHPTNLYVCADCGYLEFYAQTGFDLQQVKEKFTKVKKLR